MMTVPGSQLSSRVLFLIYTFSVNGFQKLGFQTIFKRINEFSSNNAIIEWEIFKIFTKNLTTRMYIKYSRVLLADCK